MSAAKIVAGISGLFLLLFGCVGTVISILAIFDPVGTKMADDGDPFGTPPSLLNSLLILFVYLCLCGAGAFLIWRSVRKPHVSA